MHINLLGHQLFTYRMHGDFSYTSARVLVDWFAEVDASTFASAKRFVDFRFLDGYSPDEAEYRRILRLGALCRQRGDTGRIDHGVRCAFLASSPIAIAFARFLLKALRDGKLAHAICTDIGRAADWLSVPARILAHPFSSGLGIHDTAPS
ncbi:MAG: hypothetical protein ACOCXJ_09210 [Planctomycetota bacterium]